MTEAKKFQEFVECSEEVVYMHRTYQMHHEEMEHHCEQNHLSLSQHLWVLLLVILLSDPTYVSGNKKEILFS